MAFTLEEVVPWGRSLGEYRGMFALSDSDLRKKIIGCADGPASFNFEVTALGGAVISCDPIYTFSAAKIRSKIDESSARIVEYARSNADEFVWSDHIPDADTLAIHRMKTMDEFLADFEQGRRAKRYVAAELPMLPFSAREFELAISSHFLFLYSEHRSEKFHVDSIRNMVQVADEARIFPLLELGGNPSRHLAAVTAALRRDSLQVEIATVDYEFQRGANQMMRISR